MIITFLEFIVYKRVQFPLQIYWPTIGNRGDPAWQKYNNDDYDYEESDSENIMTISPTFGIEYLIDSNFSLGADILINYMTVEDEDDFNHIDLGSNLFFRFYF